MLFLHYIGGYAVLVTPLHLKPASIELGNEVSRDVAHDPKFATDMLEELGHVKDHVTYRDALLSLADVLAQGDAVLKEKLKTMGSAVIALVSRANVTAELEEQFSQSASTIDPEAA